MPAMPSLERIRLGTFGLAALLGAGAIWLGVSAALSAKPALRDLPVLTPVQAPGGARRDDRTPESFKALTGRHLVPDAPAAATGGPPPFKLVGFWSGAAVVKDTSEGQTMDKATVAPYLPGEVVKPCGAKVVSVASPRAVFLWHGAEVVLTLEGVLPAADASGLPAKTEFTVTPDEWAAAYRDWGPNGVAGVRGLAVDKDGVHLLDSMPENFPARRFGLKPGDVVKGVNGKPLTGNLLELADLMKSMSSPQGFTLDVDRGGRTFSVKIHTGPPVVPAKP